MAADLPALLGVDFSSRPTRRKPIVVAFGQRCADNGLRLLRLQRFPTLAGFGDWLADPGNGPWTGGFDLPFGLPRELVESFQWPRQWLPLMQLYSALPRSEIRARFADFCAARPAGSKFAHRACDRPAGSSPSMKWVNPPVAYMMHAGVALLIAAGVDMPRLHAGDPQRIALEAYPGLLARELIGRQSYKSDDRRRQTPQRRAARQDLIAALQSGSSRLGLHLRLSASQRDTLIDDASGDSLDAVLCLLQAAWAAARPDFGMPALVDPLEGWIVTA